MTARRWTRTAVAALWVSAMSAACGDGGANRPSPDPIEADAAPQPNPDVGAADAAPPSPDARAVDATPAAFPDAQRPDAAPGCVGDDECARLEVCDAATTECVYDPRRQAYRLASVTVLVNWPDALREYLDHTLASAVGANTFNLIVQFNGFIGNDASQPLRGYVVQGQTVHADGELPTYTVAPYLPSLLAVAMPAPCRLGGEHCYLMQAFDVHEVNRLRLWIPAPAAGGACRYQPLTMVATVRLELSSPPGGGFPNGGLVVEGFVTRRDAERFEITDAGTTRSLADVFDQFDVAPDVDTNFDEENDAWQLFFGGAVRSVELLGTPAASLGATPPGCGD
jgi:hypothetical protein